MAYSKQLQQRFNDEITKKIENTTKLDKLSSNVGTGLVGAPACGDVMKMMIEFDENGNIKSSSVKTFGCGAAIASASLASDMIKNKTIDEALSVTNEQIAKELKLPPVKRHCSLLAEQAIRAAIADFQSKKI
jgi:NifU-like protein involved in Fe-S cluster formation